MDIVSTEGGVPRKRFIYATDKGKCVKWSKISKMHLYKLCKNGKNSLDATRFWSDKLPSNFHKMYPTSVYLKDSDMFSNTSKILISTLCVVTNDEIPIDVDCISCNVNSPPFTLILSILLPNHHLLKTTSINAQPKPFTRFDFPHLDLYIPCLDVCSRRTSSSLLQKVMKPNEGAHSQKPLFMLFYDFECHSESMSPCSIAFSFQEFSNNEKFEVVSSRGEEILSSVLDFFRTKYGSSHLVHVDMSDFALHENSTPQEMLQDQGMLEEIMDSFDFSEEERQFKIFWFQKNEVVFIHLPGAQVHSVEMGPLARTSISLTALWIDVLHKIALECSFLEQCALHCENDMESTICGANVFLYAHNNARFDLVLFVPELLKEICYYSQEWSLPKYLQNGGKIIRFDATFRNCVNFMFRDSILMVPTNSKSLDGVAKELKLSFQKKKFDFWMLDAALIYVAQFSSLPPSERFTLRECLENQFAKKHHQVLLTGCSPQSCYYPLHCKKVPHLTFDAAILPNSLSQLEASLCLYNIFDVFVLRKIVLLIYKDYIAPHFNHVNTTPYSILHCGTLASTAYREMTNAALQKLTQEFPDGSVQMFLAQGVYDVFMRKSIFGGRTVSTCIGNSAVAHAGKWMAAQITKFPNTSMHFASLSSRWVEYFHSRKLHSWDDLCKLFNHKTTNCLRLEHEMEELGILQTLVHVDISSMYPSALCSPQPVGVHSPMTPTMKDQLNFAFRQIFVLTKRAQILRYSSGNNQQLPLMYCKDLQEKIQSIYAPFENVPFVAMVKATYPEDLYEFAYNNCTYHTDIVFGHLPMHTKDYKKNLFTAQNAQTHWAIGCDLPVILSCIDIFLLMRVGPWLFEIVEALTWSHWSQHVTHATFERWYESKVEAEQKGEMAKRYILKIKMNSSYGGCAVNSRTKKSYELVRFDNENTMEEELDPEVSEQEIQMIRSDVEASQQGFVSTSNTCSLYNSPAKFFHPSTSQVFTASENALPIASPYQDVTQQRIGVFRETDHKQFPLTSFGSECNNARYAPFSIFCLSFSRLCFFQMLLEVIYRRARKIPPATCDFEEDFRRDARWSDVYYNDTDSLTLSLRLALYYNWRKRGPIKIGVTDTKTCLNSFSLAVECCGGQKECKFWADNGIKGMPCLRVNSVFGRKSYQEFCVCCGEAHIRAKGQNLKDSTIKALTVESTKMMNECALWESRKIMRRKLQNPHTSMPEWERHRQTLRNLKGCFLHKVPFRSCLLRTPGHQSSWRKHHKTNCGSCKKAKTRLLNQENSLSTSRFAMKIHLFKKDCNITQQPTPHSLSMCGEDAEGNSQQVIHPSQGYSITGDSVLTRQFSPNPDADLLPCPHCQLQLPQYVHYSRRSNLLNILFKIYFSSFNLLF